MMQKLYVWNSTVGPFYIAKSGDGRFHAIYEDQPLGSYDRPEQAAAQLAGGHTFKLGNGIDTSQLGISSELKDWRRLS
jgi:hypothetical protein